MSARRRWLPLDRVLDPAQIEALASRAIPRLILPAHDLFARRAGRLESLAPGHSVEGYLRLAAAVCRAQAAAAASFHPSAPPASAIAAAREHAMPLLPARGMDRDPAWRGVLRVMAADLGRAEGFPPAVGEVCRRLAAHADTELEQFADRVLAAEGADPDPAAALLVSASLAVLWTVLASGLKVADVRLPAAPAATCPVCGVAAVASIVRSRAPYTGYRYLSCGLCSTQWHRVRVECTECGAAKPVAYHSIEGGSAAIRAETCDDCHAYRKIFYQEHDDEVEPLADDLASLALDLMLEEAGFARAGANPLYWQPPG